MRSRHRGGAWDNVYAESMAWSRIPEGAKDPRPLFARNVVYLLQGRFADAWKAHALCLETQQDIAAVGSWVNDLLARHVDCGYAHLIMGLFLAQSGQSDQSVRPYTDAARLLPQSAYPHYFLAQIHERAGHPEMAIKAYREAVRLAPDYGPARMNLGVAYQHQGRLEMAIKEYREVIKLTPNDSAAHSNLACALAEQGKLEPAVQSYKTALKLNPQDAEVHFALGGLYETRGRLDLAQRAIKMRSTPIRTLAPPIPPSGGLR